MLVFKHANYVNVFTEQVEQADIAVEGGTIVGVGRYTGDEQIDCTGKTLIPGLIDGHIHLESTMLHPAEFTRLAAAHGTAAVVADPHEIANVCGVPGIRFMLNATADAPVDCFFMLPSCVPAAPLDEAGCTLLAGDLAPLYENGRVLGLGEMMNYVGVLARDPEVLRKIAGAKAAGKLIDGHAPGLSGAQLDAYLAAGITSDHECSQADEAQERIRKGEWVMVRDGTAARNLRELMPMFDAPWYQHAMLCTDDKDVHDLLENGHLDSTIRRAVALGADPVRAVKMASYNAALYFGLHGRGAIAPGYRADIVLLSDLPACRVERVYHAGKPLSDAPAEKHSCDEAVLHSFNLPPLRAQELTLPPEGKTARVIDLVPGQLLTHPAELPQQQCTIEQGVLHLAVIERHHSTGHRGLGYLRGYGLTRGAIASSVAHDSHNLIVCGADAESMALAANAVRENGGGWAVAADGKLLGTLPLPIGGLMCDVPAEALAQDIARMKELARTLGVPENIDPFMTLAFVSLPVIPEIKLTTRGLVDVATQTLLPTLH